MHCQQCGAAAPDKARFCVQCGAPITPSPATVADHPTGFIALDFSRDIKRLIEDFQGREWLFDEIDDWLKNEDKRFFILTGEPGVGKSAIAARLTQVRADNVIAYHFCIAGNVGTIVPNTALRSLAAQLGNTLPKYSDALVNTIKPFQLSLNIKQVIDKVEAGGKVIGVVIDHLTASNPEEELDILLRAPLAALNPPSRPVFILIDSLDEAMTYQGQINLVTLLAKANDLPLWVRFICTTRPLHQVLSHFDHLKPHTLAAESQMNLDDIQQYVDYRVGKEAVGKQLLVAEVTSQNLTERVVELSQGNFLYTKMLLNAIEDGQQPLSDLAALPKSLDDIYHRFLRRFSDEDWDNRYQPILGKLAVAQEPITEKQLANFTTIQQRQIRRNLAVVEQYLDILIDSEGNKSYRLFHQSLRDYLIDEARSDIFWCDSREENEHIADHYIKHYQNNWSHCDLYGLRYLPLHLTVIRQNEILRELLLDFDWLQAKLQQTDVAAVIADFGQAEDDGKLRPVRKALQQSAHILTVDKAQLAGQLLARIPEHEKQLRDRILDRVRVVREPWLRPLTASLATERSNRWLRPTQEETLDSVTFSPNGLWAAHVSGVSWSKPSDVTLWNLREWQSLGPRFKTLARFIYALALSDDGRWCLYADSIGGVHRLDALSDEAWEGHAHRDLTIAKQLAISSDGRRALSACYDGRLVAWDIDAGLHEVIYDDKSENRIEALCLDSAGNSGVVARRNGPIDLIDLWPARPRTLFKLDSEPSALARSSDNSVVAAATVDGVIEVRSVTLLEPPIGTFVTQEKPTSLALSSNHRYLAIGTANGTVEVWNIESKARSARFRRAHSYEVKCIVFSHDGARVVSADSLQIKEWAIEAADEEEQGFVDLHVAGQVKVTADGLRALTMLEDGRFGVWNTRTGVLEAALPCPAGPAFGDPDIGPPVGLMLAAKAPRVLSWNEKLLSVWDLGVNVSVRSLPVADTRDAALTPDGKGVVYVNGQAVSYWIPDEGKFYVIGTYDDDDPPRYVAISPDGLRALSSGGDRQVHEWSLDAIYRPIISTQRMSRGGAWFKSWWPDSRDKPSTIAFAGPEEAIVTTGDGSLFALHIGEGKPERFVGQHGTFVSRLLVTTDGRYVVTSSHDRKIMMWHLGSRRCIAVFDVHPGNIEQLSQSTQRALLYTFDGVLKVVSLSDGSLLAAFQGDKQIVTCAADAELCWIVACDQGGQMHFLHLEDKA